jgi:hypothetical protein
MTTNTNDQATKSPKTVESTDRIDKWLDRFKLCIGYCLGAIAASALVRASFNIGTDHWLNVVLLIFGGLLGWVTGILSTPLDKDEKSQFSAYAAAISTFLSGFVVAKVDKIYEREFMNNNLGNIELQQALIFGSAFLLGMLFTFIGRRYLNPQKPASDGTKATNGSTATDQLTASASGRQSR